MTLNRQHVDRLELILGAGTAPVNADLDYPLIDAGLVKLEGNGHVCATDPWRMKHAHLIVTAYDARRCLCVRGGIALIACPDCRGEGWLQ